jgi:hypothetical protein
MGEYSHAHVVLPAPLILQPAVFTLRDKQHWRTKKSCQSIDDRIKLRRLDLATSLGSWGGPSHLNILFLAVGMPGKMFDTVETG